jgi:hypothetical protein
MHVRREDMYIYVSSLLKCKMHLHLHDSVGRHLYYATVKFKVQIYIYIALLKMTLLPHTQLLSPPPSTSSQALLFKYKDDL